MFRKIFTSAKQHKIITAIILIVVFFAGYYLLKSKNTTTTTTYILGTVTEGTITSTVTGSGQTSVSNQVDVKAKSSGDVTSVSVKAGQEVKKGALLAQVDATDALKAVRDAKTALDTAKLELEEILEPTDELTLLQSEDSLLQAQKSKENAEDDLIKSYEDGFNTISNAFLDLPTIMTGLNDILFSSSFNDTQNNLDYYASAIKVYDADSGALYYDDAYSKFQLAKSSYDKNFTDYKNTSRFSDDNTIESLITESYETTKNIAEAVKSANNLIRLYQDKLVARSLTPASLSNTHLTNLSTYTSKTNSYLSSLLSAKTAIPTAKDNITSAERSIKQKELSLEKTKAGSDDLTIRAKKIAVQQKQDALTSAYETLADCSVRAPFDGVVAKVSAKKGDSVSSGTSIATIITKQQLAEISLNEVDAAKIKVGQKATLTFDAVTDLTISGEVAEVDTLGTVSQGVVTYSAQIMFDTQDERIKPGMSVAVSIITEIKQDVLTIPNSAIKTINGSSYVEMPNENVTVDTANASGVILSQQPKQQAVEIGLASDTSTEIVSGLNEGETIIIRTISSSTSSTSRTSTTSSNRSILQTGSVRVQGGPPGM